MGNYHSPGRRPEGRVRALDGLRGIAAVGVALGHAYGNVLFWTWTFVDLFFVLSGYLIGSIIINGLRDGSFSLRNFWIRRVLRIWPVYFLALAACVVLTAAIAVHKHTAFPWQHLLKSIAFVQLAEAYVLPREQVVELYRDYLVGFGHSWSLAVEEQFYVLCPLVLLWCFNKPGRERWLVAILSCTLVAAIGMRFAEKSSAILGTRVDGLILGVTLALAFCDVASFRVLIRRFAATFYLFCAIGLSIVAQYLWDGYHRLWVTGAAHGVVDGLGYPWVILGFALSYACLVAALIVGWMPRLSAVLSLRPLVHLGTLSYAIYMYHVPLMALLERALDAKLVEMHSAVQIGYWLALLAAAQLSRVLVENRLDRLKHRYPVVAAGSGHHGLDVGGEFLGPARAEALPNSH